MVPTYSKLSLLVTYQRQIELNHNHKEIQLGTYFCRSSGPNLLLPLKEVPASELEPTSRLD